MTHDAATRNEIPRTEAHMNPSYVSAELLGRAFVEFVEFIELAECVELAGKTFVSEVVGVVGTWVGLEVDTALGLSVGAELVDNLVGA